MSMQDAASHPTTNHASHAECRSWTGVAYARFGVTARSRPIRHRWTRCTCGEMFFAPARRPPPSPREGADTAASAPSRTYCRAITRSATRFRRPGRYGRSVRRVPVANRRRSNTDSTWMPQGQNDAVQPFVSRSAFDMRRGSRVRTATTFTKQRRSSRMPRRAGMRDYKQGVNTLWMSSRVPSGRGAPKSGPRSRQRPLRPTCCRQ